MFCFSGRGGLYRKELSIRCYWVNCQGAFASWNLFLKLNSNLRITLFHAMHNLMSFYFSITTVGQINRPSAGLFIYIFIYRSTDSHICIIHLLIPKLVPKVTELAEVSLSTPSLRLKYARDSFNVSWSFNIEPVIVWRGAEWGRTRGVCSPETATKTVSFNSSKGWCYCSVELLLDDAISC